MGAGSANRQTNTFAYGATSYGASGWANIVGNRSVPFDDQVNVMIDGVEGQVRMPRSMLPPIHGGNDGWFKIKSMRLTENEITGSAGVNFANSPKIRIDRITGNISMSGKAGDYSGRCTRYDPATVQRAF